MKKATVKTYQIDPSALYYADGDKTQVVKAANHDGYAVNDKVTAYKCGNMWQLVHNSTGLSHYYGLEKIMNNEEEANRKADSLIRQIEGYKTNGLKRSYGQPEFLTLADYMKYIETALFYPTEELVKLEYKRLNGLIDKHEACILNYAEALAESAAEYLKGVKENGYTGKFYYYDGATDEANRELTQLRENLKKLVNANPDVFKIIYATETSAAEVETPEIEIIADAPAKMEAEEVGAIEEPAPDTDETARTSETETAGEEPAAVPTISEQIKAAKNTYIKCSFGSDSQGLYWRVYAKGVNANVYVYSANFDRVADEFKGNFAKVAADMITCGWQPWKMDVNNETVFEGGTIAEFLAELAKIGVKVNMLNIRRTPDKSKFSRTGAA